MVMPLITLEKQRESFENCCLPSTNFCGTVYAVGPQSEIWERGQGATDAPVCGRNIDSFSMLVLMVR